MNKQTYAVPYLFDTHIRIFLVDAESINAAAIDAMRGIERMYDLPMAYWSQVEDGSYVRYHKPILMREGMNYGNIRCEIGRPLLVAASTGTDPRTNRRASNVIPFPTKDARPRDA